MLGLAFALSLGGVARAESMFKVSAHVEVQPVSPESTQMRVSGRAEVFVEMMDLADRGRPFHLDATLLEYPRDRECGSFSSEPAFCNGSTFFDMADPETLRLSCNVAYFGQCGAGYDLRAVVRIGSAAFSKRSHAGCAGRTCPGID